MRAFHLGSRDRQQLVKNQALGDHGFELVVDEHHTIDLSSDERLGRRSANDRGIVTGQVNRVMLVYNEFKS